MINWRLCMAKIYKNVLVSPEEVFLRPEIQNKLSEPINNLPAPELPDLDTLRKEAYETGYIDGKTAQFNQIEQETVQVKQQLESLLSSIPETISQNRLHLSSEIADIVLHIVQQFFIEHQHNHQGLIQQINQILAQLNHKQTVELYLHPRDIAILQNTQVQLEAAHLHGLKIKGDESLILGGCIIKTSHGVFDISLEKQIEKLKTALLQIKHGGQYAPMA